ncbi:MAG TPA: type II secretion system F family protein [Gaiellaceae bacterium]|nr:type II secretion system F family protein [Gaiellaceae bacterium]
MLLVLILAASSFVASLVVFADTVMPAARRRRTAIVAVRRVAGFTGRRRLARPATRSQAFAEQFGVRASTARFRERLPQRLATAGLAGRVTPEAFLAFRLGSTAIGVLAGLCLSAVANLGSKSLLLCLGFGVAGFVAPTYVLERRARRRRQRIHADLPDALDLLAVTVEAGLGLHGAIARMAEATTGPLADELTLVLTELRVGDSSERALNRMAKRLQSPEVESLVRSLIQGEQLGLSLAQTLRNLSEDVRHKRRLAAEEEAAKAPVKMLLPTALFIFPALFVVILGPAFLELKKFL